jgi:hypothetical protein
MKNPNDNKRSIVQIEYDAEKLEALRFYLGERNATVENELIEAMDVIFRKNVPAQVRGYINRNAPMQKTVDSE